MGTAGINSQRDAGVLAPCPPHQQDTVICVPARNPAQCSTAEGQDLQLAHGAGGLPEAQRGAGQLHPVDQPPGRQVHSPLSSIHTHRIHWPGRLSLLCSTPLWSPNPEASQASQSCCSNHLICCQRLRVAAGCQGGAVDHLDERPHHEVQLQDRGSTDTDHLEISLEASDMCVCAFSQSFAAGLTLQSHCDIFHDLFTAAPGLHGQLPSRLPTLMVLQEGKSPEPSRCASDPAGGVPGRTLGLPPAPPSHPSAMPPPAPPSGT